MSRDVWNRWPIGKYRLPSKGGAMENRWFLNSESGRGPPGRADSTPSDMYRSTVENAPDMDELWTVDLAN